MNGLDGGCEERDFHVASRNGLDCRSKGRHVFRQGPLIHRNAGYQGPSISQALQQVGIRGAVLLNRDARTLHWSCVRPSVESRQQLPPRVWFRNGDRNGYAELL